MRQIEKQTRTDGENKMGVMPVNRLLVTMALPIMISMIIQAMYNIVDSLFVARISEQALTAVSLAYSVQNLLIGVAVGTGSPVGEGSTVGTGLAVGSGVGCGVGVGFGSSFGTTVILTGITRYPCSASHPSNVL